MGKHRHNSSDREEDYKKRRNRSKSRSCSPGRLVDRKHKKKKKHKRDRSKSKEKESKAAPIFAVPEGPSMSILGEEADNLNPFGDPNLNKTFVWKKKLESEGLGEAPKKVLKKMVEQRKQLSEAELEKVRKNRLDRDHARQEREAEMELLQRQRELDQHKEWSEQERKFHLEQARERSRIRIAEGRPQTVDVLARYISSSGIDASADDMDVEMREAYSYLIGLTKRDLEDLLVDVKVYEALDHGVHDEYWRDIAIIAADELRKLRKRDPDDPQFVGNRREAINTTVNKDVTNILKGKTYPQLALLETQIMQKITAGEQGTDISYWESLLEMLKAHMARARLKERHQQLLQNKLYKLKQEQNVVEDKPRFAAAGYSGESSASTSKSASTGSFTPIAAKKSGIAALCDRPWEELTEDDIGKRRTYEYSTGSYSPAYDPEESLEKGLEIVDADEDLKRIEFKRTHKEGQSDLALEAVAKKGMDGDEAQFSVEAPLAQKTYLWSDKYRPRKPRYFNRVHTGFEWNKYNQTHYDLDNPPPKIVQGYKFNIFYPDLLNPAEPPTFTLVPDDVSPDFATLKFEAGPPYEDIAFRVVNREWEISHGRGYRCQFQNGIFQLWFLFKRYRYRR